MIYKMLRLKNTWRFLYTLSLSLILSSCSHFSRKVDGIIIPEAECLSHPINNSANIYIESLWIEIDNCSFNLLNWIPWVWDKIRLLYSNNLDQFEVDIKTDIIALFYFLSKDISDLHNVVNFHKNTPRFLFWVDEAFFWEIILTIDDFPIDDLSYFLNTTGTISYYDEASRREFISILRFLIENFYPRKIKITDSEDGLDLAEPILDSNSLWLVLRKHEKWSLPLWNFSSLSSYWGKSWYIVKFIHENDISWVVELMTHLWLKKSLSKIFLSIPVSWNSAISFKLRDFVDYFKWKKFDYLISFFWENNEFSFDDNNFYTKGLYRIFEGENTLVDNHRTQLEIYNTLPSRKLNHDSVEKSKIELEICSHSLIGDCLNFLDSYRQYNGINWELFLELLEALHKNTFYQLGQLFSSDDHYWYILLDYLYWESIDERRIKDLISLINKGINLSLNRFGLFLSPKNSIPEDADKEYIYFDSWLNSKERESYIDLLLILDLSNWPGWIPFSLKTETSDNRGILIPWFIDFLKLVYSNIWRKIYFYELDMLWGIYNDEDLSERFFTTDFNSLRLDLKSKLESKRRAFRILKRNIPYSESSYNIEDLSNIDLFRLSLILHFLDLRETRFSIWSSLEIDFLDTSSEHWWIVTIDSPYFKILDPRSKIRDRSYKAPYNWSSVMSSVASFHYHSVWGANFPMLFFSWPSDPDLEWASKLQKTQFVITRLVEWLFNIDYYTPEWIVIDLGLYTWD